MIESLPDVVSWERIEIPYRYYCSPRRRTLAVTVLPDLSVRVRAPSGTSRQTIRRFVLSHARWIVGTKQRLEQHAPRTTLLYRNGETHFYVGRQFRLEVRQGKEDSVARLSDRLLVTTVDSPTEEKARGLLTRWYRSRAEIIFHERLEMCALQAARVGIPLPELSIRKMRTRWGSFSPKKGMTLNLMLVRMPVEYLDYVILHELCHYKVPHHGPEFWKLLAGLMPDCKVKRKALNDYSARLSPM